MNKTAPTPVVSNSDNPNYEVRFAKPYVGWPGWFFYVWDLFVVVFGLVMVTDVYPAGPWAILGILIATIVVSLLLWLATGLWFSPWYESTRMSCSEDGLQFEEVMSISSARTWRDYPGKVREDLKAHNDLEHYQGEFMRSIFIVIFLGVFIAKYGQVNTFTLLTPGFTDVETMAYVISKLFTMMMIGSAAWSFGRLAETHSDFMFRHMTAIAADYTKSNNREFPTGAHFGSNIMQRNNNANALLGKNK